MTYNNWNTDKLAALRTRVSRYHRKQENQVYQNEAEEYFIEVALTIPAKYNDTDETLMMRKVSSRVVTLQSTSQGDNLNSVPDSDNPAYTVTMYHYGNSTFTNNSLRLANQRTTERKDVFTAYTYTDDKDALEIVKIVGHDGAIVDGLNLQAIANMIDKHMTKALSDDSAKQWTTKDGRKVAK